MQELILLLVALATFVATSLIFALERAPWVYRATRRELAPGD